MMSSWVQYIRSKIMKKPAISIQAVLVVFIAFFLTAPFIVSLAFFAEMKNAVAVTGAGLIVSLVGYLLFTDTQGRYLGTYFLVPLGVGVALVMISLFSTISFSSILGSFLEQGTLFIVEFCLVFVVASMILFRRYNWKSLHVREILLFSGGFFSLVYILTQLFIEESPLFAAVGNIFSSYIFFAAIFIYAISVFILTDTHELSRKIAGFSVVSTGLSLLVAGSNLLLISASIIGLCAICYISVSQKIKVVQSLAIICSIALFVFSAIGFIGVRSLVTVDAPLFIDQEIHPSLAVTTVSYLNLLEDKPLAALTGYGANSFPLMWDVYMPDEVLRSVFWNTRFNHGANTIVNLAIEYGMPIAMLFFMTLCAVVFLGYSTLHSSKFSDKALLAFPLSFLFFWLLVYVPDTFILLFTSFLIGVVLSSVRFSDVKIYTPQHSLFTLLLKVWIGGFGVTAVLLGTVYTFSLYQYGYASELFDANPQTYNEVTRRLRISSVIMPSPLIYRKITEVYIFAGRSLYSEYSESSDEEILEESKIQASQAVRYAEYLRDFAPKDYRNLIIIAEAYLLSGSLLEDQEAIESALLAYQNAEALAPQRLQSYLLNARVLSAGGYNQQALESLQYVLERDPTHEIARELYVAIVNSLNQQPQSPEVIEE